MIALSIDEKFDALVKTNVMPICVSDTVINNFIAHVNPFVTILDAKIPAKIGGFTSVGAVPEWYKSIYQKKSEKINLLVIQNLPELAQTEQMKFFELFKYRKIGDLKLPKNCVIIIAKQNNSKLISQNIYSLLSDLN